MKRGSQHDALTGSARALSAGGGPGFSDVAGGGPRAGAAPTRDRLGPPPPRRGTSIHRSTSSVRRRRGRRQRSMPSVRNVQQFTRAENSRTCGVRSTLNFTPSLSVRKTSPTKKLRVFRAPFVFSRGVAWTLAGVSKSSATTNCLSLDSHQAVHLRRASSLSAETSTCT